MVGTVEPRKGHDRALAAFEELWSQGSNTRLLIVGKVGWMVDGLVERIRSHPENGKRLLWIENASDTALAAFYQSADLLLAASFAEGFGLPLVEAARHDLPILARDIAVFREVADSDAVFFADDAPEVLADAIERSLAAGDWRPREEGRRASVTWAASAERLMAVIGQGQWHRVWHPAEHNRG